MEHVNWFHAAGPATTNARSPNFVLSSAEPLQVATSRRPSATFNAGLLAEFRNRRMALLYNVIESRRIMNELLDNNVLLLWWMALLTIWFCSVFYTNILLPVPLSLFIVLLFS